jgi:hypothetical protein
MTSYLDVWLLYRLAGSFACCSVVYTAYQIKYQSSDLLSNLYKSVGVSGYSRCYRRCWNIAEWVRWRRFVVQTRRRLRDTAGTVT